MPLSSMEEDAMNTPSFSVAFSSTTHWEDIVQKSPAFAPLEILTDAFIEAKLPISTFEPITQNGAITTPSDIFTFKPKTEL